MAITFPLPMSQIRKVTRTGLTAVRGQKRLKERRGEVPGGIISPISGYSQNKIRHWGILSDFYTTICDG